ncbi:NUDIX domain-containing protein [Paenibacillus popilliae]|uniref:NUDIX domain-containing protein n=1 Tax=Paenibacillus popilliae TaxID=78057 RepID=A0ABY3ANE4_PAEPP|nr:NUDIX domain-containing protein [Paenibacillus sp. SDF0028]TQR44314.1 NUDIX domain-containing protein [Paenibacillus sp. SDF0028]
MQCSVIKHTHLGVYGVMMRINEILLIKKARGPHTGKWDLPGGRIEFGEEPYPALLREIEEETGIANCSGTIRTALSYTLIHPYAEDALEELHHIGIIYNVDIPNDHELRVGGDGEDSLGACWIAIEDLPKCKVTPLLALLFELDDDI